jgi:hypothetical protein
MPSLIHALVSALGVHEPDSMRDLADAMRMKVRRAAIVGAVATMVTVGILLLGGWVFGEDLDPCALFAQMVVHDAGVWPWIGGFVIQVIFGALVGIVYAAVFEWFVHRAGALVGIIVAVPHVFAAGLGVGLLALNAAYVWPSVPPGAFMALRGPAAVWVFCVAHLAFGTLMGAGYGHVLHQEPRRDSIRWREMPSA